MVAILTTMCLKHTSDSKKPQVAVLPAPLRLTIAGKKESGITVFGPSHPSEWRLLVQPHTRYSISLCMSVKCDWGHGWRPPQTFAALPSAAKRNWHSSVQLHPSVSLLPGDVILHCWKSDHLDKAGPRKILKSALTFRIRLRDKSCHACWSGSLKTSCHLRQSIHGCKRYANIPTLFGEASRWALGSSKASQPSERKSLCRCFWPKPRKWGWM